MNDEATALAVARHRVRAMGRDSDAWDAEGEATARDIMDELDALEQRIEACKHRVALEARRHLSDLEVILSTNRLVTVGTLTVGMAHEFGTPLAVILARAQMILTDEDSIFGARKDAEHIVREIRTLTRRCREVLDYARPHAPARALVEIVGLLRSTFDLLNLDLRRRRVRLVLAEPATPVHVLGDTSRLMQVLTNVIINGAQAMPTGGAVHVRLGVRALHPPDRERLADREYVCIEVEDSGVGIPRADLATIFDGFFSTRRASDGAGLGLAVSSRIIREHQGWIGVDTVEGSGSTFTVYLPRTAVTDEVTDRPATLRQAGEAFLSCAP